MSSISSRPPIALNRFYLLALVAWQFAGFFTTQNIFPIFASYTPDWKCGENGTWGQDCSEYTRCKGEFIFADSPFQSAVMEFKWICDNRKWKMFFAQAQFAGVLTGTIVSGMLSDVFGRKPIAIASILGGIVHTYFLGTLRSVYTLLIFRFVIGLFTGGCVVAYYTYIMELILPQHRMLLRGFFNWGISRMMLTAVCWYAREWRAATTVHAAVSLPGLFLILLFPESPTWLHSQDRDDAVEASEKRLAVLAGVDHVRVHRGPKVENKSLLTLLRSGLLKRLLVLWIMWFTASACGFAIELSSNSIAGDLYLNQMLFGLFLFLGRIAMFFGDRYIPGFSRRALHQGAQLAVCIVFAILAVLTLVHYKGISFLIFNLLGTIVVEYTWDACYLCATEGAETSSRASVTGSASLCARAGSLLSPIINHLNHLWPAATYTIVVGLGLVNLLQSFFFLVETKGVELGDVTIGGKRSGNIEEADEEELQALKN